MHRAAHRIGTDGLLLARFCVPRRAERAADLGSGCGIIALAWHDAGHRGPCAAVELNGTAHELLVQALAEQPEAGGAYPGGAGGSAAVWRRAGPGL